MTNIPTVELSLETLIRECSLRTKSDEEHFNYFLFTIRSKTHEIFKYHKFHYDFTDTVTCYNDESHIIGYIRPSYQDFLKKLLEFLNMKDHQKDVDDIYLTKNMLERVETLRKIRTERELKEEFPVLYDDLMMGRKYIREVKELPERTEQEQFEKQQLDHYYYASGLKRSLHSSPNNPGFLDTQCAMYTRFILKRWQYKEYIENSKSLNAYFKSNFDKDKIAIYAMYKYLLAANACHDKELLESYLNLAERYQASNYVKDTHVTMDDGRVINQDVINTQIKNLKKRLDSKERLSNCTFLPPGKRMIKETSTSGTRVTVITLEELKNIKNREKREFYQKHKESILAKVEGAEGSSGYIAFILKNGEVLFENLNESEIGRHAIYHIKAIDFERLSHLDKTTLRSLPEVERIIHTKNWEQRVEDIIQKEGTEEEKMSSTILAEKLFRK